MTRGRRTVLFVSPDLPSPPSSGSGMRIYQLVRQLSVHHDVTFLAYQNDGQHLSGGDLAAYCSDVVLVQRAEVYGAQRRSRQVRALLGPQSFRATELASRGMQSAIDRCLSGRRFDVVHVETSPLCGFDYGTDVPVVVDEQNVESELMQRMSRSERTPGRRAFNALEAAKYRRFESAAWRSAAGVALTSERERQEVQRRAPGVPTAVVPNGVDPEFFAPADVPAADQAGIVFNGILSYRPNVDAVEHFLSDVLPLVRRRRPDVSFTVVGRGPDEVLQRFTELGAVVTGFLPDLRPVLAQAACVVVPIRMGGGTRLKIVEALSMGLGIVSTPVGAEGIAVRAEEHLLLSPTADDMATDVLRLLDDPALRSRLGRAGRRLVVDTYSWERCAAPLDDLYGQVVSARAST